MHLLRSLCLALVMLLFFPPAISYAQSNISLEYLRKNLAVAVDNVNGTCASQIYEQFVGSTKTIDPVCEHSHLVIREARVANHTLQLINYFKSGLTLVLEKTDNVDTDGPDYQRKIYFYRNTFTTDINASLKFASSCMSDVIFVDENTLGCEVALRKVMNYLNGHYRRYYSDYQSDQFESVLERIKGYDEIIAEMESDTLNVQSDPNGESDDVFCEGNDDSDTCNDEAYQKPETPLDELAVFDHNIARVIFAVKACDNNPEAHTKTFCRRAGRAQQVLTSKYSTNYLEEYEYYSTHPVAAKFALKTCRAKKTSISVRCRAAKRALEELATSGISLTKDMALQQRFEKEFKENFEQAAEVFNSTRCQNLFADEWYYIDEALQDEKCDAAKRIVDE